jgi:hypothetical protein
MERIIYNSNASICNEGFQILTVVVFNVCHFLGYSAVYVETEFRSNSSRPSCCVATYYTLVSYSADFRP